MNPRIMMWANYRRGFNLSVPSPADGDATIPWFYDKIASLAHEWAGMGVTDVLGPPPLKSNAGAFPGADGYGPFDDYDLGQKNTKQFGGVPTRYGYIEQFRRAVAICHSNGMNYLVDHVMHQRQGGKGGVYRYLGAPSDAHTDGAPDIGRFPKDPPCFRGGVDGKMIPPFVPEDPVPSPPDDFPFGDELSPLHGQPPDYVAQGLIDAGDWLFRTAGIDGARLDDMKGMAVSFVHRFMTSGAMKGKFFVGEYASGNRNDTDSWTWAVGNLASAMDFDFHYNMAQPMCNNAGSDNFFMGSLAGRGMIWTKPLQAVPFVESMDSDVNGFATIIFNKELGYALLLGGEGLPLIYLRDYLKEPDCYGLKDPIHNLSWCRSILANGPTVARLRNHPKVYVFERTGDPGLVVSLNNDVWNPQWYTVTVQTNFGPNVRLHDFTGHNSEDCWTDALGKATFGVPPGANGRGYGCWSRAEYQGRKIRVNPRSTTQTFFGAGDLPDPPARNGHHTVGRIWCAAGSKLSGALLASPPNLSSMTLLISDAGGLLSEIVVGSEGIVFPAGSSGTRPDFTVRMDGWISFALDSAGLPPEGVAFELQCHYTGTRRLA